MSISKSILFNTDSYKVSMWKQYPEGTEYVFSYIEARGGKYDSTVLMGIKPFIKEYLCTPITKRDVLLAAKLWEAHGEPFNMEGWMYIVDHCSGNLPIKIRAAEEGLVIPTKNVLVTIENTDPKVPWLTTWVETALLRAIWYPSSVATVSYNIKKVIKKYLLKSGDIAGLDFKLHDFGARGTTSFETATLGAMSHLAVFKGTDTFVGVLGAMEYYGAEIAGFSIPAAEHSTITSWGKENEVDAYANMVEQFAKPGSIYAVVSDSYDIFQACHMWGGMRNKIVNSGATLVVRPDSGDPTEVLPRVLNILEGYFGSSTNDKGYFVLNNVRVIWGDGINQKTIEDIYAVCVDKYKWSADNLAFGMGGALLNHIQRDDLGWAMKCSAIYINGKWREVYKDPITAKNKTSKKGRITLMKDSSGNYYTGVEDWVKSELETVYSNGLVFITTNFDKIRENIEKSM